MNLSLFPLIARRFIFSLVAAPILVCTLCAFPVLAHVGISEEIEAVTAQLEDEPGAPELYLLRGDLHRINGHWPEAIADFNKVLQLDRDNALAELGLGRTWLDRGRSRKALRHLDRALAREPGNVRALVSRARAYRQSGRPLEAAADYQRAIATFTAPANPIPEYYFERARALEAAGADYIGAAIATLDAGITRLGKLRIFEDYAIELERRRGNYGVARQRLDRIIERSVRKETLLLIRGEILLEAGEPAAAAADFAAARNAIAALPEQRRHSRAMNQMRSNIDQRMQALKQPGSGE